jgi:hypothetical protein
MPPGRMHESVLEAQSDFIERILKKKESLNISSVPAHDYERNCTETDQCNQGSVPW